MSNNIEASKIGLITFYKDNFGSILQCFATKKVIENNSYKCIVLDYNGQCSLLSKISKKAVVFFRIIFHPFYFIDKIKMKKVYKNESNLLSLETKKLMDIFINKYLSPCSFSETNLRKIGEDPHYSYFVVGSDQVWNLSRDIREIYFLEFVPKHKRIAFAPSFGVVNVPARNKHYLKKLTLFNSLSFREQSACELAKNYFKGNIELIGDPTIMLTRNEWLELANSKFFVPPSNNFVLVHFINEPNLLSIQNINEVCNNMSCVALCIGYKHNNYDQLVNYKYLDCDPFDFINLLDRCQKVFTDSFHSVLFSINFSKDFYCYKRNYLHKYSQETRITDLLSRFNLLDRFIENIESYSKCSSTVSSEVLLDIRSKTKDFLIRSIENERNK